MSDKLLVNFEAKFQLYFYYDFTSEITKLLWQLSACIGAKMEWKCQGIKKML